jgi:hypothetical protein
MVISSLTFPGRYHVWGIFRNLKLNTVTMRLLVHVHSRAYVILPRFVLLLSVSSSSGAFFFLLPARLPLLFVAVGVGWLL